MAQVTRHFSFEIIPNPAGGDARMTVLMLPHAKGIAGDISAGEMVELVAYLEGVQDKMMREKKQTKNEKGENV
jgi:hypothetical protein